METQLLTRTAIVLIITLPVAIIFGLIQAQLAWRTLEQEKEKTRARERPVHQRQPDDSLRREPYIEWWRILQWQFAGVLFFSFFLGFVALRFILRNTISTFYGIITTTEIADLLTGLILVLAVSVPLGYLLYQLYFYIYWNRPFGLIFLRISDPAYQLLKDFKEALKGKLDRELQETGEDFLKDPSPLARYGFGVKSITKVQGREYGQRCLYNWRLLREVWLSSLRGEDLNRHESAFRRHETIFILLGVTLTALVSSYLAYAVYELLVHFGNMIKGDFIYGVGLVANLVVARIVFEVLSSARNRAMESLVAFFMVPVKKYLTAHPRRRQETSPQPSYSSA